MSVCRPTGTSNKAHFKQWLYDRLSASHPRQVSSRLLTDYTPRGTTRRVLRANALKPTEPSFRVVWHFERQAPQRMGLFTKTDVEGGFCPQTTIEERNFIVAGQYLEAINSDRTETQSRGGEALGPYSICQSRVYQPDVDRMRVRVSSSATIPESTGEHWVYLRVMEFPFESDDEDEIPRDFGNVFLLHDPTRSVEGCQYYRFDAGSPIQRGSWHMILPTDGLLGILQANGDLLKPRPDWGDTWLKVALAANGGTQAAALFRDTESAEASQIYHVAITEREWTGYLASESAHLFTIDRGDFMGRNAAIMPFTFGPRYVFEVTIEEQPDDGDTISIFGDTRTWRSVVINPATEIEIGATLADSLENFHTCLIVRPFSNIASFALATVPFSAARQAEANKWLIVEADFGLDPGVVPNRTLSLSPGWASVEIVNRNNEAYWAPNVAAVQVGKTAGTDSGTATPVGVNWMKISLSSAFDQIVTLPQFNHPFCVQAFFSSPLEATILGSDAPAADITLEVEPA